MRTSSPSRFSFTRTCAFTLCLVLLITSQPVAFYQGLSFGQGLGNGVAAELRTLETPLKNLPDLSKTEQEKMKLGSFRIPEGQPATRCRHHDEKCKIEKKEKISWLPTVGNESRTQIAAAQPAKLANPFRWDAPDSLTDALIGGTRTAKAAKTATPAAVQTAQDSMKSARLDPQYRQGGSGEDLYSRNYHWDFPLLNLPGRAGMDLNLSLNYNSLMWVKRDGIMFFDPEVSPISPGFTLNFPYFPKFHTAFQNANNNRYVLWLLLPNGSSVELRDSGDADLYESADSTYTQYKKSTKTLTTSDGTRYYYLNGYMCTRITDRNGNYISITYVGSSASIDTITDTAGRVVKFIYDPTYYSLQSIALQTGPTTYRTLATFSYTDNTLGLNFAGLGIVNAWQGMTYPVLKRVTRHDGYFWEFDHSCYGQVNRFRRNPVTSALTSPELVELFYDVAYNTTVAQSDCPRFTTRYLQGYEVQPGNGNWVSSSFLFAQGSACGNVTIPDGTPSGTVIDSTKLSCGTIISPDTLVRHKTYFYNDGTGDANYKFRGLPLLTVSYDFMTAKKYDHTKWEQTDGYAYQSNPRVCETLMWDTTSSNAIGNKKRTVIKYRPSGASTDLPYNLPAEVCEYAADTTTLYRRSVTEYNLDNAYTSRRILGLVKSSMLYDGANTTNWIAKTGYCYDGQDGTQNTCSDCLTGLPGGVTATQHDAVNYPASYPTNTISGRGNLTNMRRYDAISPSSFVESKTGYNLTGSVVFTRDAEQNQTSIEYADAYYDNNTVLANLNTFAYPTKTKTFDLIGSSTTPTEVNSTAAYEYYWGAIKQQTNPKGAMVKSDYDPATGLLMKVTNYGNNAHTEYAYDGGKTWVKTFTTINDTALNNRLVTTTCLDGFDRTRAVITDHPGSAGGFKTKMVSYDARGNVVKDYNWTETTGAWTCAGDDAAMGFCWTASTYDWKNRPKIIYNQDYNSTTKPNSKRTFDYEGCGCAGGNTVTATDEMGRKTKSFYDVMGRMNKSQTMKANGTTPYVTTTTSYDVRDLVQNVTECAGDVGSGGATQQTLMTYDGHGRLKTRKRPQEDAATTFDYYANDWLKQSIDSRSAKGTLTYTSRGLLKNATYVTPGTVAATNDVTFEYDLNGMRSKMIDGPGNVTYQYDSINRLNSETRTFSSIANKTFPLSYQYNLAGQLTMITDSFANSVNYARDKAGRVTAISGSPFTGTANENYASGIEYRAWDATDKTVYGSSFTATADYTARLQVKQFDIPNMMGGKYNYNDDGQLSTYVAQVTRNSTTVDFDRRMDRTFGYDEVGRINSSFAGGYGFEAKFSPQQDEFGNMTNATYHYWQNSASATTFNATYVNNRAATVVDAGQTQTWSYDAMGNRTGMSKTVNGVTTSLESFAVDALGRAKESGVTFARLCTFSKAGTPYVISLLFSARGISEHQLLVLMFRNSTLEMAT